MENEPQEAILSPLQKAQVHYYGNSDRWELRGESQEDYTEKNSRLLEDWVE